MSDIYLSLTETPTVVTLSQPVVSGVLSSNVTVTNVVSVNVVTMPAITVQAAAPAVTTVAGTVAVSNFPASSSVTIGGFSTSSLPPSTVTVANSVTIGNFPSTQTISGTVTVGNSVTLGGVENNDLAAFWGEGGAGAPVYALNTGWKDVDGLISDTSAQNPFPIQVVSSGAFRYFPSNATTAVKVILGFEDGSEWRENNDVQPIPVRIVQTGAYAKTSVTIAGTVTIGNSVTIGSLPSGALTTRFGSVTTANTAQITSAVTNTSRKYLLAQNISAGTVTIGIGFSPTTTQGIQLTAGGGLTFDAFCPTGAVYWLGAVTGAAYTILEG